MNVVKHICMHTLLNKNRKDLSKYQFRYTIYAYLHPHKHTQYTCVCIHTVFGNRNDLPKQQFQSYANIAA